MLEHRVLETDGREKEMSERLGRSRSPIVLYCIIRNLDFPFIMNKKLWQKAQARETRRMWQEAR